MERLLDLWQQSEAETDTSECDVYVVHQGEAAQRRAALLAETLRDAGQRVLVHAGSTGFKSQFKRADASGAAVALIIGPDELAAGQASLKWLRQQEGDTRAQQETLPFDAIADTLKTRM